VPPWPTFPAAGLHRADQIDAIANQILSGADAGGVAADVGDLRDRQVGRLRHGLEDPRHITAVERLADPAAFQHGAEQRSLGDTGARDPRRQMAHGVGGDRRHLAGTFLVGLAAAEGDSAETIGVDLQILLAQGDQFRAAAQGRISDGNQRPVAALAQRVAGRREHAGDQHVVDRGCLGLGAAAFAMHALEGQLDRPARYFSS
jgi:hypothetical protein